MIKGPACSRARARASRAPSVIGSPWPTPTIVGLERGQALQRHVVLLLVQVEGVPAGAELRPGRDGVADDREAPLGPREREMARVSAPRRAAPRTARTRSPSSSSSSTGHGNVLGPVEPEPELERDQLQRLLREDADRLRAPVAGDDVGLPAMRVDGRAALALERGQAAEMRTVAVRDRDPLQVGGVRPSSRIACSTRLRVVLEERVDERELTARVDEERVHAPALAVAEAVDAGRELDHAADRCHGANGFSTPRSAGSSSGKCRSSSVRIELSSTQSMPSFV